MIFPAEFCVSVLQEEIVLLILEPQKKGKTKEERRMLRKSEGDLKKTEGRWGKKVRCHFVSECNSDHHLIIMIKRAAS